ncbi:lipopolysaccharide biosynthesis protein [Streptococcus castoreus]|uniref:lipopolysaccharide biosynthesis protein n=1 Tax=Streptococcus castoreus TaxID=254786 RepID=UPI000403E833|nr:lipopolysaccharide biosynthesis protein [Streptococcus castoreus]
MSNFSIQSKKIFLWNMLGSLSTAAISVVLLMVVTRFLTPIDSDNYAFAYSFANMMVVVALFQVRNYQATDINEKYSFSQYLIARLFTCALMLAISVVYLVVTKADSYKSEVIFLVCVYRLTDAFSDLYQGMFQQHERLDIAGKSLTYRNSLIFIVYTAIIWYAKDLILALEAVCLISGAFILFYDLRKSRGFQSVNLCELLQKVTIRKSFHLLKESFPLFLNGFLIIYIYTQPKYSIENLTNLGKIPLGSQTIFNILFMPAFVMNLMMLFFRPHITQMAIALIKGQIREFNKIQVRLFSYLSLFALLVLMGSGLLGLPFLAILYGTDLKEYWIAFMLIMLGGSIGSFATAIDNILTAMRKQKFLLIPYSGGFLFSLLITNPLVKSYHILGASLSFLFTMLFWCGLSIAVYVFIMNRFKKGNAGAKTHDCD